MSNSYSVVVVVVVVVVVGGGGGGGGGGVGGGGGADDYRNVWKQTVSKLRPKEHLLVVCENT
jgi:hypothetical protein